MAVMVLYGLASDQMLLKVQEIVSQRRFEGWDVREVDAKKNPKHEIENAFDVGLFDIDPVLVVLRTPSKVKGVKALLETEGLDVLVVQEGSNLKILEGYPSHEFPQLKGEKLRKGAMRHLQQEIEKHGRTLTEDLAEAVVKRVGTDYGVLRWEALKYGYSGKGAVTPQEVLGLIAPLSEAEGTGILDSIGKRNVRDFLRECDRVRSSKSSDPTMALCSGLLTRNLLIWVEVLARMDKGQGAQEINRSLKMNPYILEKVIMVQARALGKSRLLQILKATSKGEIAVLSGAVNPWIFLKASILRSIL